MPLDVETFTLGLLATNAFLLTDRDYPGEAVLIDAPLGAWDAVHPKLRGRKLGKLLLTHGHFDHVEDAALIRREAKAKTFGHADDKDFFENPAQLAAMMLPEAQVDTVEIDEWIAPGSELSVLGRTVEIRHVPGHAPGNVLFYFPGDGLAFVGDAIFAGGVGRPDIPGGHWPTLEKSIREQIYTLPEKTTLYPGHGPTTTVGEEKTSNPFVTAG